VAAQPAPLPNPRKDLPQDVVDQLKCNAEIPGELAQAHSLKEMEKVTNCIRRVVRERDPESELTTLFWDFGGHKFEYIIQRLISPGRVKECSYAIPPELVDELVLGREGAEERLAQAVGNDLALMAG